MQYLLIPILYEDAPNYIRNEPQRAQRTQRKKLREFGAASQRNGISQFSARMLLIPYRKDCRQ